MQQRLTNFKPERNALHAFPESPETNPSTRHIWRFTAGRANHLPECAFVLCWWSPRTVRPYNLSIISQDSVVVSCMYWGCVHLELAVKT
jgi:hypothetical protein